MFVRLLSACRSVSTVFLVAFFRDAFFLAMRLSLDPSLTRRVGMVGLRCGFLSGVDDRLEAYPTFEVANCDLKTGFCR